MSEVAALGYVGMTGPIEQWRQTADVLGLQVASERTGPDGTVSEMRFRVDDRAWRIAVHAGEPGIGYIGWEVGSRAALRRIQNKLTAERIEVDADPELATKRGVLELLRCQDPSGFHLEFFYGPEVSSSPFVSPTGARFVTSVQDRTLGLGHVVMFVDDVAETTSFYMEILGFAPSDSIIHGAMGATFAHINPRHHSLAFGPAMGPMAKGIDHIMLEVDDMDVVGCALDRLTAMGVPVTVTLGRHSNDHMTSFYFRTPSGFDIEYGVGGRIVEDSWVPTWFRSPSIWGHRRTMIASPSAIDHLVVDPAAFTPRAAGSPPVAEPSTR